MSGLSSVPADFDLTNNVSDGSHTDTTPSPLTESSIPIQPAELAVGFKPDYAYAEQVERSLRLFDHYGRDENLDRAIIICKSALQQPLILSEPQQLAKWSILEATAFYLRFERDGETSDIDAAENILQGQKTRTLPSMDAYLSVFVDYGLGRIYEARFDSTNEFGLVGKSCEFYRDAMSIASATTGFPPHMWAEIAAHLGRALMNLYHGGKGDISDAPDLLSNVVQRNEAAEPVKVYALAYLSWSYYRFWSDGDRESEAGLLKSEELIREALFLGPNHRYRSRFLRILAQVYMSRDTADWIRKGIEVAAEAKSLLRTLPPVHYVDGGVLRGLATGYQSLFVLEGRLEDLDQAIALGMIPGIGNSNICLHLCVRFVETGRMIDIDHAIEVGHELLRKTQNVHSLDFIRRNLGLAYTLRFAAGGERDDFEKAQAQLHNGLTACATPVLVPPFLSDLARLYSLHFDFSAERIELDESVDYGREALVQVRRIRDEQNVVSSALSDYGAVLLKRFEHRGDPQDLKVGLLSLEEALDLSSDKQNDRHVILYQYGHGLRLRFELDREQRDSETCQYILQDALDRALVLKLPIRSIYLGEMADLHYARYICQGVDGDLELSLDHYIKACQTSDGFIRDRFRAAVTGARLAQKHGLLKQSTDLFSLAIALLPRIAWIGINLNKRHAKLVQATTHLACDAAACAIRNGDPERAVEFLDEGRSILWQSVLQLRTDLRSLEEVAPKLAEELLEVAQALEQDDLGTTQVSEGHAEQRAARRRRSGERWEELVASARCLEGFQSFLMPLDYAVLRQAATDGPVIFLNVSEYGSDALIISLNGPVHAIPLPGLSLSTVRRLAYLLTRALQLVRDQHGGRVLERVLLEVSRHLWNAGIGAVAKKLRELRNEAGAGPLRVWWIPTGLLSLLPIHCAGPYTVGQPGIPELFISSYSTTLSALLRAHQTRNSRSASSDSPRPILGVGLPETPGFPSLPCTRAEIQLLTRITTFREPCALLYGPDATVEAVTRSLPHYSWIHACCHGHHDQEDPLKNAFHLINGPLTLGCIVEMRLQSAEFAFLSACHTARHNVSVPDESLHLTAGLQIAGFQGVLGTAWSMVDSDGLKLAERFYHWMTAGGRALDARNAAEALHLAIRDLRSTGLPLYRWAPFVHFGI